MYSLTCFGRPHAHHKELNYCSNSLWFLPLERGGISVVGRGRAGRPVGPTTTNITVILEQTANIFLYSINRLVFITETESVYCALRTK
jgi:hypothetical protein